MLFGLFPSPVRRFVQLSWCEKRLFFEAVSFLFLIKGLLGVVAFRSIRRWIGSGARIQVVPDQNSMVILVVRAVGQAQRMICWKRSRCLVNALTAQRMLLRRGISTTLHLGSRKVGDRLEAHAWLDVGGVCVVGGETKSLYESVASFASEVPRAGGECS